MGVEGVQGFSGVVMRVMRVFPILAPPVERGAASWGWLLEPEWGREKGAVGLWVEWAGLAVRKFSCDLDNGARNADWFPASGGYYADKAS